MKISYLSSAVYLEFDLAKLKFSY